MAVVNVCVFVYSCACVWSVHLCMLCLPLYVPLPVVAVVDVCAGSVRPDTWHLATATAPWGARQMGSVVCVDGSIIVMCGYGYGVVYNDRIYNDIWYSGTLGGTQGTAQGK
jgi:hypothetical protein